MAHLDDGRPVSLVFTFVSRQRCRLSAPSQDEAKKLSSLLLSEEGGGPVIHQHQTSTSYYIHMSWFQQTKTPAHASKWEKRQEETSDLNNPILGASCSGTHVPPLLSTYGKTLLPEAMPAGSLRLFTASYLAYAEHDRSLGLSLRVRNRMSNSPPTMVMGVGSWACGSFVSRRCYACVKDGRMLLEGADSLPPSRIQSRCFGAWYALPQGRLSRTLLSMCPKTPYRDRLLVTASARFSYDES